MFYAYKQNTNVQCLNNILKKFNKIKLLDMLSSPMYEYPHDFLSDPIKLQYWFSELFRSKSFVPTPTIYKKKKKINKI